MRPTALIYSSHDRSEYIHREYIINRALSGNKTILHLPMSQRTRRGQQYDYGCFKWYYQKFRREGLNFYPFYWNDNLRPQDIDIFFEMLMNSEVVVMGGGNSSMGLARYKALGQMYYNDSGLFGRILHERQDRGLLTVGFSAGADQLCQYLSGISSFRMNDPYGFGLAGNIAATVHHTPRRRRIVRNIALRLPHCLAFGLPNDSGLAVHQGYLPSGNIYQVIWFIIDCSWDLPNHAFHIKTRQGVKIFHSYNDGRKQWLFSGGDMMIRMMTPDGIRQDVTVVKNSGALVNYWTKRRSVYRSIDEIFQNN